MSGLGTAGSGEAVEARMGSAGRVGRVRRGWQGSQGRDCSGTARAARRGRATQSRLGPAVLGVDWRGALAHGSQGTASPVGAGQGAVGASRRWRQGSRGECRLFGRGGVGPGRQGRSGQSWRCREVMVGGVRQCKSRQSGRVESRNGTFSLGSQGRSGRGEVCHCIASRGKAVRARPVQAGHV